MEQLFDYSSTGHEAVPRVSSSPIRQLHHSLSPARSISSVSDATGIPAAATSQTSMQILADTLFGMFERGDFVAARSLFAADARLIKHYTNSPPIDYATFEQGMPAMLEKVGKFEYQDRVVRAFDGGFVEQHTTQLTGALGVVKLKVCLIATVDANGKILTLEEYLDPSPFMRPS
eukprot:gene22059-26578_t